MKTWQWVVGLVLCVALIAVGALAGAQSRRLNEYQGELTGYVQARLVGGRGAHGLA